MNKNAFSLLNGNWMFSGESNSILMPFLLNIIKGGKLDFKDSLPETAFNFISQSGIKSSKNLNSIPTTDSVVVLKVHHPIFKYDQDCGPKGTQTIMNLMESWKSESNIKGIVFDYNSGGGQASGTPEIAEYIYNYTKPTVSFSKDVVGSAAYYMYAASDYNIAHKHLDFIGCIGAMAQKVDLTGVIEKAGGKVLEFYADKSPEKNAQSRALKEGDERPLIEKFLNPNAEQFHLDLKVYRPNISEKALKGDVFNVTEGLKEGLFDSIGTLQDAIDKVFELSQTSNSNSNTNMSKKRPLVEAVLGLDEPLASNDNGVYLNNEQVDAIEQNIESQNTAVADLQTQLQAAQDNTELNAQLTTATDSLTVVESNVDAMLTEAGLTVEGTLTEKLNALSIKVTDMAGKDGASHTNPKVAQNTIQEPTHVIGGIDISQAMNN